jgi:hypothetical protein
MLVSRFSILFSVYAFTFVSFTACQLQRDGMAIIDAGKADKAADMRSERWDTADHRDAQTVQTQDAQPLKSDTISIDIQSRPDAGPSVTDSSPGMTNSDGSIRDFASAESLNHPVDLLPSTSIEPTTDAISPVLDASPVDLFMADSVLDIASPDLATTDSQSSLFKPVFDWRLDNLSTLGDQPLLQVDKPSIVQTPSGAAVCFDGKNDGLVRGSNPLTGLSQFTLQIFFRSDQDNLQEMHLLHIEEPENIRHRFILETRSIKAGTWYPRVFIRWDDLATEIDQPTNSLSKGDWYWVAFSYDGVTARLFVNGEETVSKQASWGPIGDAPLSLGMRLNKQGFFPGCFAQLIVTSTALPAAELHKP